MKNFSTTLKKALPIFKNIFLLSVVVIVVAQLSSLSKTVSVAQVQQLFLDIAWWKLLMMVVVGLIAVAPMIGYDIVLNQLLERKQEKTYLVSSSWFINTLNNLAGFGGLISIGLRSELYGKGVDSKKLVNALSKILLFLMSGLSIYSLFAFGSLFLTRDNHFISQYWLWLIGGGLYFPVVFLVTKFKKEGMLGGLTSRNRASLVLTSFLEWTGVLGTFLVIGWLMGVPFQLDQVVPIFIAAQVIGIVSMIPGAIGSFDVMVIIGLGGVGIAKETVITWLLLYRVCYYLLPFLAGVALFAKHVWQGINDRYDGVIGELLLAFAHKLLVFFLYFSGAMMVILATIPAAFEQFKWLAHLNPWRYHLISQFPSVVLGFLLIAMGRGVRSRVKRAYIPTIALLTLAAGYTFLFDFSFAPMIFLLILLVVTIASKSELYRQQFVYSWEAITKDSVIVLSLVVLYIVIGVYNLPHFLHRDPRRISFFLFPSEKAWLFGLVAILIVTVLIALLLRYFKGESRMLGEALDEEEVLRILHTHGGNLDSQLVFLGDKRVYYYHDGTENTVFLQINTYNDKCAVMGDPSGKASDFPRALAQFIDEADEWGYAPVFYEITEEIVMHLHQFGYDFIKMGEKADVDLTTFTLTGKKRKSSRANQNKFTKDGFAMTVIQPPFTADLMQELKVISDKWLGSRKEKGFSLGFFAEDYLARDAIAIVKNQEGEIVAFANLMPTYTTGNASIDLMRHNPATAPTGTMDYLFVSLFEYLRDEGYTSFDLGMAPLANVGTSRKSFFQERVAALVYQFGSRFYSFQGLKDYKSKYATTWEPRYTAYSRKSWIIYVMGVLQIIDNASVERD